MTACGCRRPSSLASDQPRAVESRDGEFASRANLTADKFVEIIGRGRDPTRNLPRFCRIGLVWREIIRGKFAPTVSISDSQIDRALANGRPMVALPASKLSEIVIPAVGAGRDAALQKADHLRLLLRGARISQAWRGQNQYSIVGRQGFGLDDAVNVETRCGEGRAQSGAGSGFGPVVLDDRVVIARCRNKSRKCKSLPPAAW